MIKKLSSIFLFALLAFGAYGQTIVSTNPENKKVILEEFTGIYCVFCPQGHAIAQAIQDANPGNAFLINIHVGSFASPNGSDPDFRTPWGNAIANQSGLIGYPAGTVNRHNFPGFEQGAPGTTAMSRNVWANAANQTLAASSDVNVGVEADIDVSTNEMTVHVEAYYTANSPQGTNLLNVALLQNNTLGPQTGGNAGNEYVHMHRLVHMVTGQWGVTIPTTTSGTFVDETFTYTIPADYNGIPVELADLEVVAFVSETQQEIPSGSGAYPTYSGFTHANDAFARYVVDIDGQCGFDLTPSVNVQNVGNDEITSLEIDYSVNGGTVETYNWTGSIMSLQNLDIELPAISYTLDPTLNTIEVSIQNDDNAANNDVSGTFENAVVSTPNVSLILNTSNQGAQITWDLTDSAGTTIASGGPYANNTTVTDAFVLPNECYRFSVNSANGNGGGSIVIYDDVNTVLYQNSGDYDEGDTGYFSAEGLVGIGENSLDSVGLFPNPASTVLNIMNAENANIEVYNMLGQVLYTKTNISNQEQLQVSSFTQGTYFVKITDGSAVKTSKFLVTK
jgi:hypothetical protein